MTQLVFVSGVCFTVVPEKAANCGFIEQNRDFYLFYIFFFRRERPPRLRRSFPSWYTKYIKTNIFSNCDSRLIHFKIKAKRIVS